MPHFWHFPKNTRMKRLFALLSILAFKSPKSARKVKKRQKSLSGTFPDVCSGVSGAKFLLVGNMTVSVMVYSSGPCRTFKLPSKSTFPVDLAWMQTHLQFVASHIHGPCQFCDTGRKPSRLVSIDESDSKYRSLKQHASLKAVTSSTLITVA